MACAALLLGPIALAFFDGGIHEDARAVATISVWALVGAGALLWRRPPLPRRRPGLLAAGGLAALTALVAASGWWAPLGGPALDDRVRLVLYLGAFLLAVAAWPSRRAARMAEPAVAAGALVVIGYGLSERLLADLLTLERSVGDSGLLKQPLTYWNATGALAAVGIVLLARLAGDSTRAPRLRAAAAAALAPLGAAAFLTCTAALTSDGSGRRPLMGKFAMARAVWTPK